MDDKYSLSEVNIRVVTYTFYDGSPSVSQVLAEEAATTFKMAKALGLLALIGLGSQVASGAIKLESYNVDTNSITISGLSAGGAMVQQFHIAHSSIIKGAGVFAGLPYACAKAGLTAATMCMSYPAGTNVNTLINEIQSQASAGQIDSPTNLEGHKVYIFHGTKDTTVNPQNGKYVQQIYEHFGAEAKTDYGFAAVHGFPTNFYGAACGSSSAGTQYINYCNYHAAYEMLQYFYGDLSPPDLTIRVQPIDTFGQSEFITALTPGTISMDSQGFVYIPTGCRDKTQKCRLHISFHGCQQYKGTVGDAYATKTGFLQVAEANNIIVLFPQAAANMMGGNPNGCWDWWGYLNSNFINRDGAQQKAVSKMMERVAFCDGQTPCYEDSTTAPPETETTTSGPSTPTSTTSPPEITTPEPTPGECVPNEVSFHPLPGSCKMYYICACGTKALQECATGLYFDPSIKKCNLMQLVPCDEE